MKTERIWLKISTKKPYMSDKLKKLNRVLNIQINRLHISFRPSSSYKLFLGKENVLTGGILQIANIFITYLVTKKPGESFIDQELKYMGMDSDQS